MDVLAKILKFKEVTGCPVYIAISCGREADNGGLTVELSCETKKGKLISQRKEPFATVSQFILHKLFEDIIIKIKQINLKKSPYSDVYGNEIFEGEKVQTITGDTLKIIQDESGEWVGVTESGHKMSLKEFVMSNLIKGRIVEKLYDIDLR